MNFLNDPIGSLKSGFSQAAETFEKYKSNYKTTLGPESN